MHNISLSIDRRVMKIRIRSIRFRYNWNTTIIYVYEIRTVGKLKSLVEIFYMKNHLLYKPVHINLHVYEFRIGRIVAADLISV